MKRIISTLLGLSLALGIAAAISHSAQTYKPPRTSEGLPDLQGIWEARNSAATDIQKFLVGGGTLPYKPEAAKKKTENAKTAKTADPLAQCFMAGVPRTMYLHHPFQLFVGPGYALIASEYAHTFRYIRMDGSAQHMGVPWAAWPEVTPILFFSAGFALEYVRLCCNGKIPDRSGK